LYTSNNYLEELKELSNDEKNFNSKTIIVNMPQKIIEKRIISDKMKNYQKEKSEKKKEENEKLLRELYLIRALKKSNKELYLQRIEEYEYKNENEFDNNIKNLEKKLNNEKEVKEIKEDKEVKEKIISEKELYENNLLKETPKKWIELMKKKRRKIVSEITNIQSKNIELKDRKSNSSKRRLKQMVNAIDIQKNDENFGFINFN
jgi:hypothetical protein